MIREKFSHFKKLSEIKGMVILGDTNSWNPCGVFKKDFFEV